MTLLDDFLLIQSEQAGALAVDIELQRGIVDILRNEDVADLRQSANLARNSAGGVVEPCRGSRR